MSHRIRTGSVLLLFIMLGMSSINHAAQPRQRISGTPTSTFQRMIVENGSVTMDLDLNRLNGTSSDGTITTVRFAIAAKSFFPVLVLNDELRGPEPGLINLQVEAQPVPELPAGLAASLKQLLVEKFSPDAPLDLAVRDAKTGFTFFKIEGHQYDYQASARLLSITGCRLVFSKEFADSLGRPSAAGTVAGKITIGGVMEPI